MMAIMIAGTVTIATVPAAAVVIETLITMQQSHATAVRATAVIVAVAIAPAIKHY